MTYSKHYRLRIFVRKCITPWQVLASQRKCHFPLGSVDFPWEAFGKRGGKLISTNLAGACADNGGVSPPPPRILKREAHAGQAGRLWQSGLTLPHGSVVVDFPTLAVDFKITIPQFFHRSKARPMKIKTLLLASLALAIAMPVSLARSQTLADAMLTRTVAWFT